MHLKCIWRCAGINKNKNKTRKLTKATILIAFFPYLKINTVKKTNKKNIPAVTSDSPLFQKSLSASRFPPTTPQPPTYLAASPPHPRLAPPPSHPLSKLGHASQPAAHTFLSSSSFWTLMHLWSDSVQFSLQGTQDYCTYWAVAEQRGGFGVWGGTRGKEEQGAGGQSKQGRKGGSLSEGQKDKWRMGVEKKW